MKQASQRDLFGADERFGRLHRFARDANQFFGQLDTPLSEQRRVVRFGNVGADLLLLGGQFLLGPPDLGGHDVAVTLQLRGGDELLADESALLPSRPFVANLTGDVTNRWVRRQPDLHPLAPQGADQGLGLGHRWVIGERHVF